MGVAYDVAAYFARRHKQYINFMDRIHKYILGLKAEDKRLRHLKAKQDWLAAAKTEWAIASLGEGYGDDATHAKATLRILEQHGLAKDSDEAQQLVSVPPCCPVSTASAHTHPRTRS